MSDPLSPVSNGSPRTLDVPNGDGLPPAPSNDASVCSNLGPAQTRAPAKTEGNPVCAYSAPQSFDTRYAITNPGAAPSAQGTAGEQLTQAAYLTKWTALAAASHGGAKLDAQAARELATLKATPPDLRLPTELVNYSSHLEGVRAADAFAYFKDNPGAWFGASGITLHPPTSKLTDGARLFLQEPGMFPPVWAPIEVNIDERARTVRISTLDGHPLRGVNQFSFGEDARGHCELHQASVFQLSSVASEVGSTAMAKAAAAGVPGLQDPISRQHDIWKNTHADVADHSKRR